MKYLAFDLETSKIVENGQSWESQRPLGISVAATLPSNSEPKVWYGQGRPNSDPWAAMPGMQVRTLVHYLQQAVSDGYQIVTWNGLKFDFDILAEESGMREECIELAMNHLDPMFHFFCIKGFYVSLGKVADGMGIEGKSGSGQDAPILWDAGQYQRVMDYVAQDVRVTMSVFEEIQKSRRILWITSRDTISRAILGIDGVLPVKEAMKLPEPDTSWMTGESPKRDEFFAWMKS